MHLEWLNPEETEKLKAWDEFLLNSPRGHYSILSTWLRSYRAYGFDFSVLVAKRNQSGPIIGGTGLFHFGNRIFRVMNAPVSPIVDVGCEDAVGPILQAAILYARSMGTSILQLLFPCSTEADMPALLPLSNLPRLASSRAGIAFDIGNAAHQMLWVGFPQGVSDEEWREQVMRKFTRSTRRNVRLGEKHPDLEAFEARTEAELKDVYSLMEVEAQHRGAAFRSWKDFGEILIEQVKSNQALVIGARYKGRTLAVRYGLLAGRRYSYIAGARVPVKVGNDTKVGHFLTWAVMKRVRELGLLGYDFTSVGDQGVMDFKNGFCPEHIHLIEPQYFVFSDFRYRAFKAFYSRLRKHKQFMSKVMRSTQGALGRFTRHSAKASLEYSKAGDLNGRT